MYVVYIQIVIYVYIYIYVGLGVDEKSLVEGVEKWKQEEIKSFRKGAHNFFVHDVRSFELVKSDWLKSLKKEFSRFQVFIYLIQFD